MKKILMIGITPPVEGGSEKHILELSSRIKNSKVLTQEGSFCKNKIELSVPKGPTFLRNIIFAGLVKLYAIYLLLKFKKEYDLIHIHENLLYFLVPWLRLRYEVVVTVHGIKGFSYYDNKFLWFFFKIPLKFANKLIAVNLEDQRLLRNEVGGEIIYIPNGVDFKIYKKIKEKIEKKVTFLGRIHKQKGIIYLLEAFSELSSKYPEFVLEIIGKKNDYQKELSKIFSSPKIIWKGYVESKEKIAKELKSSYCIILPSLWEGLPLTLIESLASGRPVIVSDISAFKSIIKDEALFSKVKNIEDLKEKIELLLRNKKKSNVLGKKGEKLSKRYDWDRIARNLEKFYEEVK